MDGGANLGANRDNGSHGEPVLIDEQRGYLVVYKPPGIHSAPLTEDASGTVLGWCARRFPEIREPCGRRPREGGLLHRLDYETQGLLLLARCQEALDNLMAQQEAGLFIKEYEAVGVPVGSKLAGSKPAGSKPAGSRPAGGLAARAGFPPVPPALTGLIESLRSGGGYPAAPAVIESAFRAYGPGRKAVRPWTPDRAGGAGRVYGRSHTRSVSLDQGKPYRTEITAAVREGNRLRFSLRLRRGFRHQIRCHLAWIGFPLLNDALYGGALSPTGAIGLAARGLSFRDPFTGDPRRYGVDFFSRFPDLFC
ncbi:MAG: RNA pseudouridine synthase [Treponema sp.]|jgi:23S rRNA pseudouridine1911/1915/1917 synthase|nr:RNA pseudouridine synthase [Treponema sp.]